VLEKVKIVRDIMLHGKNSPPVFFEKKTGAALLEGS